MAPVTVTETTTTTTTVDVYQTLHPLPPGVGPEAVLDPNIPLPNYIPAIPYNLLKPNQTYKYT